MPSYSLASIAGVETRGLGEEEAWARVLEERDTQPPLAHNSEPGDTCPSCFAALGSPSPCAISHDFAPGAYPSPEPDIEPAVEDEPR